MSRTLLITPPFLQPNAPYPATSYLNGFLKRKGYEAEQFDLSIELLGEIFSKSFIENVFAQFNGSDDSNIQRIYTLRNEYIRTIDIVMTFLRGKDSTLAQLICSADFLPQASRFDNTVDITENFGWMGLQDCAQYLSTLYLQDISDFIRATVTEHFEIVRYGEKLSSSLPEFSTLEMELMKPRNMIENKMTELLRERINATKPDFIAFTVPFPGNLLPTLRCGQYIKTNFPDIKILIGGGYPTTELRDMKDKCIFSYIDYVILDDGEVALEEIISGRNATNTYTEEGFNSGKKQISHSERGCPDFSDLPFDKYFSLCEVVNPMHRLWSNGRWNKMMIAHGCYWAKCAFCDTSLDYVRCYDSVSASQFVDWMEIVANQTGSRGFHFVDEAAPPKLLKEISLELLRRGLKYSWWTNIRFENAFTGDLCQLMASAGCIAVSGGLEVASDRLLAMIDKGITIEQATIAMRNFYYAGIMTHTYLMYGLPTQTLQESIDALEVVRQLFKAELINSAFWHRYAMTIHSPSGQDPEKFGVKRKGTMSNPFANNEIYFSENRGYNINIVGEALNISLANYMVGNGLDKGVHKWFDSKVPATTIEATLITDHLIKPDGCRIFDDKARLVWIGGVIERNAEGVLVRTNSEDKHINLPPENADFIVYISSLCGDLSKTIKLSEVKDIYKEYSQEPLAIFYHSKKWDILRGYGLLQI